MGKNRKTHSHQQILDHREKLQLSFYQFIPGILPSTRTPRNPTISHNGCKGKTCGLKLMHLTQLLFHSAMVTPMVAFRAWPRMHVSLYLCMSVSMYPYPYSYPYLYPRLLPLYVNTNMDIMHVHMYTFMQTHSICTCKCTDIYLFTCN